MEGVSFSRMRPTCSDLGFGGVPLTVFVKSQCSSHFSLFLVYRLLVTGYLLGYFLYDMVVSVRPGGSYTDGYYLIYFTNWGNIIMRLYLCCALWNLFVYLAVLRRSERGLTDGVPWYFFHRGQWLLFNLFAAPAILICIMYWSALYVPGTSDLFYDINFHLLLGVAAVVEVLVSAIVVRLLHFVYPLAFVAAYAVFSGVYWAAGGTDEEGNPYIYPVLDYGSDPGAAAGLAVGLTAATVVVHCVIVWGLCKLRVLLSRKCCPSCTQASDGDFHAITSCSASSPDGRPNESLLEPSYVDGVADV